MMRYTLCAVLICTGLSACSPYEPRNTCDAMRNELNSEIIFNGATGNDREAALQRAQKPLQVRSYERMTSRRCRSNACRY